VRVAAIDCGTNSVRLLIADVAAAADDGENPPMTQVAREMRIVRLGQDVDRTRQLAPEAINRTRVALTDYAATITRSGAERVRMIATSALRDTKNRSEFTAMVREVLGVEPEVVSGSAEAALSFAGAVAGLPPVSGARLLVDIGGGSTELVRDGRSGVGLRSHSMDVGAVRLTERHLRTDPPTATEVQAAVVDVRTALAAAQADVPLTGVDELVGVAGTVTTVAAMSLGLTSYDSAAIHGSRLAAGQVHVITDRLLAMTVAQRREIPVMHPGRADVIGGGVLILRTVLDQVGCAEVLVSEQDILDGIARSLARSCPSTRDQVSRTHRCRRAGCTRSHRPGHGGGQAAC
jgi:exopolyphosphatase/guanosine-5'-triphosphate,3'-diphosphate pyrophosphatase